LKIISDNVEDLERREKKHNSRSRLVTSAGQWVLHASNADESAEYARNPGAGPAFSTLSKSNDARRGKASSASAISWTVVCVMKYIKSEFIPAHREGQRSELGKGEDVRH
jgi:hypothetical protein